MSMPTQVSADGHAVTTHYDLHGYRVAVTVPNGEIQNKVAWLLSGFLLPGGAASPVAVHYALRYEWRRWAVYVDDVLWYRCEDLAAIVLALEWRLVNDMLAASRDAVHLHGATLLAPTGRKSVVIVGESGAGKTTLTLALMARGFLPYADDVTLIDPRTLAPRTFPRAFHLDDQTRALVAPLAPPTWDFTTAPPGYFRPPEWATVGAPVRLVFFPTLSPEEPARVAPCTIPEAVAALLPFSATLGQHPPLVLAAASRLVEQARCFRLITGELTVTADLVHQLVMD